jgi:hypothetical protein
MGDVEALGRITPSSKQTGEERNACRDYLIMIVEKAGCM